MAVKFTLSGRLFERSRLEAASTSDVRDFIEFASEAGFQGVDLRNTQVSLETPAAQVRDYTSMIKDHGLEVVRMNPDGYPVTQDLDLFRRYLDLAAGVDCKSLRVLGEPRATRQCAELARERGMRIGPQNHIGKEECPGVTETLEGTLDIIRRVDHPSFGVFFDAGHLFVSGSNYGPEAIRQLADHIIFVHLQPLVETQLPPGEGRFEFHGRRFLDGGEFGDPAGPDFEAVFRGLQQVGFEGALCVFARCYQDRDNQELSRRTLQRAKALWEEVRETE